MKTLSFLFVVMLLFMPESLTLRGSYDKSLEDRFREFVSAFNKSYVDDVYEYGIRKEIFLQSLIRHDKLNREEKELGGSARYGVNQFSDLTPEEFKDFLKRGYAKEPEMTSLVSLPSDVKCDIPGYKKLPSFWDWNKKGKVTKIKNQGKCGGCWAFTATELVETQWAIAGHELEELSVQEFISCSRKDGCKGGNTCQALSWLRDIDVALLPASEYPYVDESTPCKTSVLKKQGVHITRPCCLNSTTDELKQMKPIVALIGPMAVNVDATMWHDYIDGIIQHHCTDTEINHAVQITGYDATGEVPYWIVRNSWGTNFGVNGYLYIAMNKNLCGLNNSPTFVIV
ncbi:cathepsin O [Nematostella vectensis]|uniref:cathepsin O n=1 Tax=Nematostella vectensis TaxID=45351 RepID=UPI0020770614|nr:cathepsin O [Nematostella vectensis]